MNRSEHELPTLVTTSVVRGSQQGESHGGVYLVNFTDQAVEQVVDWNTAEIDWQGRGWDRGLRGIAFFGDEIYIAASDELFVYDQDFQVRRSFRNPFLKHCHEIHQLNNHLYLTSTGFDSILAFDLEQQKFFWAIHLVVGNDGPVGSVYNPNGANGPIAQNRLHLNNVFADNTGLYASGLRSDGLLRINSRMEVVVAVDLPRGIHNARLFGDGILFNDTAANRVRYADRDGSQVSFEVPQYDEEDLTHLELGDEQVARQGFGRGLCPLNERFIAAGSSPSTISVYDLQTGTDVLRVNFSQDIRNAVHGLEIWPY